MPTKSYPKNCNIIVIGFCIIFCCLTNGSAAQTRIDTLSKNALPDSLFIKKYTSSIGITTALSHRNFELILGYPNAINIKLSHNNIQQINFGFNYKFLNLHYSYTAPFLDNTSQIKGSTRRRSIGFSLNLKQVNFRFDYARTQGFYLVNSSEFSSTITPSKPYIQFPDLINEQTGFSLAYNFNKKYSLASLTGGIEQQLKSCISFVPTFYAYYFKLHENFIDSTSLSKDFDYLKDIDLNLELPVAATIVLDKNFYLSAIAGPSIGIDAYNANNLTLSSANGYSKTVLSTGYVVRGGVGFTGNKWYCGAEGILRRYANHTTAEEKIVKKFYSVQFYVGLRLTPPKVVKKSVKWVEEQSPVKL
jgi:hypothetical protein